VSFKNPVYFIYLNSKKLLPMSLFHQNCYRYYDYLVEVKLAIHIHFLEHPICIFRSKERSQAHLTKQRELESKIWGHFCQGTLEFTLTCSCVEV
jgi:hypothetical protein